MKTNTTRIVVIRIILFLVLSLYFLAVFGQPDYVFKSGSLESGTDRQVGAVYKFSNVKSGVDARVTIMSITGGIKLSQLDGSGGFNTALQPVIEIPANANGYVEFQINFYTAGTTTLMPQAEVSITPIDIDGKEFGGLPLYEFDEIDMPNGYTYFQMAGSELDMMLAGTFARGKNNAAIDYPGIDTTATQVMFTTVNANISSITVRVGADNQSNSPQSRLRSLYFQKFTYPNSIVLPNRTLIHFSGLLKDDKVEIKGTLSASHTYDKVVVEKGNNPSLFSKLAEIPITNGGSAEFSFTHIDYNPEDGVNYYRVKLINSSQNIYEVSNTLVIKTNGSKNKPLEVSNTILQASDPVLTIKSNHDNDLTLEVFNMNGKKVFQRNTKLFKGTNVVDLPGYNGGKGMFVAVARTVDNVISQKIMVQ
ncbi:MAG TPA: T9SS type A sorting domain-containing protein [Chitinophagaceae bacterium]|nr:T9SS type A sorting domain-containing protein [Chitinophagaceae bacterium]MCB9055963.1 T9SS type A sorting domain-containing protein [Chitinophagales bacterium]HRX93206.1 T9SS type A sorting domain-containing protein [Chitinophagaceae bacterium]